MIFFLLANSSKLGTVDRHCALKISTIPPKYMGVEPKIGGKPPIWMVVFCNGKPYEQMGIFGGFSHIFGSTPIYIYIYMVPCPVLPPPPPPWYGPPPPLPPYLIHFAHTTVAKRTFPYFCMHAAVAKRTFSFCWMNPPAGFGGSIARNCGEMQILSSRNCSAPRSAPDTSMLSKWNHIHIHIHVHTHS